MLDNDSLDEIRRRMQESLIGSKREELREECAMVMTKNRLNPSSGFNPAHTVAGMSFRLRC